MKIDPTLFRWLMFLLQFLVFLMLFRLVWSHIFVEKRTSPAKYLIIFSFFVLVSCFMPVFKIDQKSYSVLSFVLNGSIPFSIMFLGYLIAFFLLLKKDPNYDSISAIVYFISWIFSWVGFFRHAPVFDAPENRILAVIWLYLYTILPMVNGIFYASLMFAPNPSCKKRVGIWKLLDDSGTNRPLIRELANRLSFNLEEESGWKHSVAKGKIDGLDIEVTEVFLKDVTLTSLLTTKVIISVKDKIFPNALILKENSKQIKYSLRNLVKGFSEFNFDNLILITPEAHKGFYQEIISKSGCVIELADILKGMVWFAPFILIENNTMSFNKPFLFNTTPALSVEDLQRIIKLMIRLIKCSR